MAEVGTVRAEEVGAVLAPLAARPLPTVPAGALRAPTLRALGDLWRKQVFKEDLLGATRLQGYTTVASQRLRSIADTQVTLHTISTIGKCVSKCATRWRRGRGL